MSLQGKIDVDGVTCRVRRATPSRDAGGSTQRTWADAPIGEARLLIESVTADRAQRLWGHETQATVIAFCDPLDDLLYHDGVIVNEGDFAGQRFRVVGDTRTTLGPKTRALGLELTKETFGL